MQPESETDSFDCDACGETFASREQLTAHIRNEGLVH